ncbi:hypothetical protein J6590_052457 [Homalodisca vitripennis]|nr:hypothetical protein J6590_052457 [Homalodisca vitripennis]
MRAVLPASVGVALLKCSLLYTAGARSRFILPHLLRLIEDYLRSRRLETILETQRGRWKSPLMLRRVQYSARISGISLMTASCDPRYQRKPS